MCLYAIAKYSLFIFNFIFWCAGAAVLGIGIWLLVDANALQEFTDVVEFDVYAAGPIIFIVAGAVMLVFGFFGCCGAIKESTCLLGTYFTMLLVILGLEVGIGVWAFINYDSVEEASYDSTYKLFTTSAYTPEGADSLQQRFKCCGSKFNSTSPAFACAVYNDANNPDINGKIDNCECTDVKDGVCGTPSAAMKTACGTPTVTNIYLQDCGQELTTFTEDNIQIIGIVGLAIGLAEIIGMFISMCLCCKIKDKDDI